MCQTLQALYFYCLSWDSRYHLPFLQMRKLRTNKRG